MKMVEAATGKDVDVPDDQVQEAYQSGKYGIRGNAPIPIVSRLGRHAKVAPDQLDDAFDRGARLAAPGEYEEAVRKAKYGEGLGNTAAAAAEAVARGVTGGASDIAAISATKALLGEHAGEAVRQHIAGEKEENPITAGVGEAVGFGGGLLIPGAGEAEAANLAAHGAELARGAQVAADAERAAGIGGVMGQGMRAAGAIPRGITYAGEATDRAVSALIGRDAATKAGRAAQKIIAKSAQAGAEGAAFGVANQIDEDYLGGEDVTAGKLLSSGIYGGLLSGAAGGVLTGAGELAREVAGQLSPYMRKLAGDQAWRAANPPSRFSETAIRRAGGREAVGQTILDKGILDGASSVEEIRDKTLAAIKESGAKLGEDYKASTATVSVKQVSALFDDMEKELEGKALHGDQLAAIKQARKEVLAQISPEVAENVAAKHAPEQLGIDEIQALAKEHGPTIVTDKAKLESLGLKATGEFDKNGVPEIFRMPKEPVPTPETFAKAAEETPIPISKFIEQRQAIGARAYASQTANDVTGRPEILRDLYGRMAELENTAFEEADKKLGGSEAARIKKDRIDYQRLNLYLGALNKSTSRFASNNRLSMGDMLSGLAGMAVGHGFAGVALHKLWRERGQAWTARYLDKLATLSALERATSAADREIDRGVADFFKPGERAKPKLRARVFTGPKGSGNSGDYEERVNGVAHATANADAHSEHVERVASAIAEHAPKTAARLQQKALAITSYLAGKIPAGHIPTNTIAPHLEQPRVPDSEKAKFNRAFDMAHDPIGTTFDRMNRGQLTATDVANLRSMHPEVYDEIRKRALDALSQQPEKIDFAKRMQMGLLLDIPSDPAIEPAFMQVMQQTFADIAATSNNAQPPKGRAAPKRQIDAFAEKASLSTSPATP